MLLMHRANMKILRINLCTKLVLFTRLYRDAWSTKHKTDNINILCVGEDDKNVLSPWQSACWNART